MIHRGTVYVCGRLEVDVGRRELRALGVPVPIGDRPFEVLAVLVQSAGELVTKDDLMRRVWPRAVVEENTLEVHVSAVRKALGPDRGLLRTAYARGYRLLGAWQVRHGSVPANPARLAPAQPASRPFLGGLPLAGSDLIGRDAAVRHLCALISAHRMVTLTGLGGIGKTRLAIEVARNLLDSFEGDVTLVELASLADAGLVASAVARALGLELGGAAPAAATVARAIEDRKLLLVLDNCEHVIDAAAGLAEAVVRACPRARVLATSREDLRIEGEHVYQVPPLDVPPRHLLEPEDVLGHSAVMLFVERMRASNSAPSKRDDHGDLAAIAAICTRLDGIPLAIEFAAARAAALGVQQVLARLGDRFTLLTGGRRTALPRQQTLRATLDWSYQLLPKTEGRLLRRVAVMAGGFTLEAATALMGEDAGSTSSAVEGLANLVAKALVVPEESGISARWRLLETVRAYALEKLAESGEAEQAARRHAEFCRDLFVPTEDARQLAPTVERMAIYGREIDNVRAALDWAFSDRGDAAIGVALTATYAPFLLHASLLAECRERAECAVAALGPEAQLGPRLEAQLNITLGLALIYTTSQVQRTGAILSRALRIASELGDVDTLLQALWALFIYNFNNSEHHEARSFAERFSALALQAGDPADTLMGDRVMGTTMHYAGYQAEARRYYDRYVDRYFAPSRQRHLTWLHYDGRILVRARLARVLWLQGFVDQANSIAQENVRDAQEVGHKLSLCLALGEAACPIAIMTGDFALAEQHLATLSETAIKQSFSFWVGMANCLEGKLLIRRGEARQGSGLLRAAIASFGAAQQSLHYSGFVGDLAESLASVEDVQAATAIVDEALARSERSGVRWHVAELLRIRGELLLQAAEGPSLPQAEDCFRSAMEVAGRQGALFWELRAALSFARLRVRYNRHEDAQRLLAPVYGRFKEGFGTTDLRSARSVLESTRIPGPGLAAAEKPRRRAAMPVTVNAATKRGRSAWRGPGRER